MKTAEILTIIVLVILLIITGLLSEIGIFQVLYFHIILAIVVLLSYRDRFGITFAGIMLIFGDLWLGLPVGTGVLVVGSAGLIISVINRIWFILRSQPFWIGRIIWLLIALFIMQLINLTNGITTETDVIARIVVVNLFIFVLVSLLANKMLGKVRYADIIIK